MSPMLLLLKSSYLLLLLPTQTRI